MDCFVGRSSIESAIVFHLSHQNLLCQLFGRSIFCSHFLEEPGMYYWVPKFRYFLIEKLSSGAGLPTCALMLLVLKRTHSKLLLL